MSKDKSIRSDEDFLARLDRVSDEIPVTDAEAEMLLQEAGVDAPGALRRLLSRIENFDTQQKQERFARADAERRAALAQSSTPSRQRSRGELLARLDELKAHSDQPQAYFRSLESVPDEDLESLVSQLEELASREKDE